MFQLFACFPLPVGGGGLSGKNNPPTGGILREDADNITLFMCGHK
jgi:hypothetical protein